LFHPDPAKRAASRELLEYLCDRPLRAEVLALVDGGDDGEAPPSLADALAAMLEDQSEAIRALAREYTPRSALEEQRHAS
jgi:hypothetical protein